MNDDTLQRAKRIADIARAIPKTWTDSHNWTDDELHLVAGLVVCRYRVNGSPPLDRVYIIEAMNAALSFEMLEAAGIRDAQSFFRVAIRSTWGHDFPEVGDDEQASRIIELASGPVEHIAKVEAVFRHGRNERDNTPFEFSDWISPLVDPGQPGQAKIITLTDPELIAVKEKLDLPNSEGRDLIQICREVEKEQGGAKAASIKRKWNRWIARTSSRDSKRVPPGQSFPGPPE